MKKAIAIFCILLFTGSAASPFLCSWDTDNIILLAECAEEENTESQKRKGNNTVEEENESKLFHRDEFLYLLSIHVFHFGDHRKHLPFSFIDTPAQPPDFFSAS